MNTSDCSCFSLLRLASFAFEVSFCLYVFFLKYVFWYTRGCAFGFHHSSIAVTGWHTYTVRREPGEAWRANQCWWLWICGRLIVKTSEISVGYMRCLIVTHGLQTEAGAHWAKVVHPGRASPQDCHNSFACFSLSSLDWESVKHLHCVSIWRRIFAGADEYHFRMKTLFPQSNFPSKTNYPSQRLFEDDFLADNLKQASFKKNVD